MSSPLDEVDLLVVQADSQLVIVVKLFLLGVDHDRPELKLVEEGAYPLLILHHKRDV